jgi:hypothetical protein
VTITASELENLSALTHQTLCQYPVQKAACITEEIKATVNQQLTIIAAFKSIKNHFLYLTCFHLHQKTVLTKQVNAHMKVVG